MTFIKDQINTISEQQQILIHSEKGNHEMYTFSSLFFSFLSFF